MKTLTLLLVATVAAIFANPSAVLSQTKRATPQNTGKATHETYVVIRGGDGYEVLSQRALKDRLKQADDDFESEMAD
jgi:hypothetical protein